MASRTMKDLLMREALTISDIVDYHSEDQWGNIQYIEESTVDSFISDIESELNDIQNMLDPIEGLSEIDEVKEKIANLLSEIY